MKEIKCNPDIELVDTLSDFITLLDIVNNPDLTYVQKSEITAMAYAIRQHYGYEAYVAFGRETSLRLSGRDFWNAV